MSLFVANGGMRYSVSMELGIQIDQPVLDQPNASRRLQFGSPNVPAVLILNGTAARFEGGADAPELSLKWLPKGSAEYRSEGRPYRLSGETQLLFNRGQPYRLAMLRPSETFALFFPKAAADAAWQALTGNCYNFPEIPTAAAASPRALQIHLGVLRTETQAAKPDAGRLRELCFAVLLEIAEIARMRREQVARIPAARRATREELLRRLLRAEDYLAGTGAKATVAGAADAAALSPFHLIRVFKAAFGKTPLAYAVGARLERAHDELIKTGKPIAEIAETAGYESRTAFDRAFARRYGATPGAVRAAR